MIQIRIDRLNEITGNPMASYLRYKDDTYVAQVGNYHLSHAYGGVTLNQMSNIHGGIHETFSCGHVPKRDLFNRLCAYIDGIEV